VNPKLSLERLVQFDHLKDGFVLEDHYFAHEVAGLEASLKKII
jgi:hypothetical protein